MRMLWPLQDTAWTASYRWFLAMIVTFTAVRLILVSLGIPAPAPACSRRLPSEGSDLIFDHRHNDEERACA